MAQSKNARKGEGTQRFYCKCGGEIKMKSVFLKNKLKIVAECKECKLTKRRPKDFM